MTARLQHRPKGSMCSSCVHRLRDCIGLDFSAMPVMYREDGFLVVRCSDYLNGHPAKSPSDIDSIEHYVHTQGFRLAMHDRLATYKPDPSPRIHRTTPAESEAAPGFPRARDFNGTPASEWAKLEGGA